MWDHPLSPTLVGRSLAFVAELSFAALCCATIVQIAERRAPASGQAPVLARWGRTQPWFFCFCVFNVDEISLFVGFFVSN